MEGALERLGSRRGFLQKVGVGAAVAWTAPSIVSVEAAAAATPAPFVPGLLTGSGLGGSGGFLAMSTAGTAAYFQESQPAWNPVFGPPSAPFAPPPVLLANDGNGRVMALDGTGATTFSIGGGPFSAPAAGPPIGVPVFLAGAGGPTNPSTFLAIDIAGNSSLWIDAGPWSPAIAPPPMGPVALLSSWGNTGGFTAVDAAGGGAYLLPPQPWIAIAGSVPFTPTLMAGGGGGNIVTDGLGNFRQSIGGGPWTDPSSPGIGPAVLIAGASGFFAAVDASGATDYYQPFSGWFGAQPPPSGPVGAPAFLTGDEFSGRFMYMDAAGNSAEAPFSTPWGTPIPPPS